MANPGFVAGIRPSQGPRQLAWRRGCWNTGPGTPPNPTGGNTKVASASLLTIRRFAGHWVDFNTASETQAARITLTAAAPPYEPRFHVVLHQPEIPGNTGAVGRTCVALAAKLWLVRPLGFRIDESTRKRAGLDYWQHLVWQVVDHWPELLVNLPAKRFWYFSKSAKRPHTDPQFKSGDVLVFGSETTGLPPRLVAEAQDAALRIPTSGLVRSLNLSCSVAVAGYEVDRQLRLAVRHVSEGAL